MQICSFDVDTVNTAGAGIKVGNGDFKLSHTENADEASKKKNDISQNVPILPPDDKSNGMASSMAVQTFQALPRVAIGLDFSDNFGDRAQLLLSPLVVFVTICQVSTPSHITTFVC